MRLLKGFVATRNWSPPPAAAETEARKDITLNPRVFVHASAWVIARVGCLLPLDSRLFVHCD